MKEYRATNSNGRRVLLALVIITLVCIVNSPSASAEEAEKVKAAFIFNFLKFIKLPERGTSSLRLCVLSQDPYLTEYNGLQGKRVGDLPLQLFAISEFPKGDVCDVLYVHGSFKREVKDGLMALRQHGVLTVGDRESFLDEGGVIRFLLENERVRFDIDLNHAKANGLQPSAALLRIARVVRNEKSGS